MIACYYLTDPKSTARDLYCPECCEKESDPAVLDHFRAGDCLEGEECVACDRVYHDGEFIFPDCWNCGVECKDQNGNAVYVKFGLHLDETLYVCAKCFKSQGEKGGVI